MEAGHKLQNVKWERFAQGVAKGMVPGKAYKAAGFKTSGDASALSAGHRLLKRVEVSTRVSQLRAAVDAKAEAGTLLTIEEKRLYLAELIRTPIGSVGPDSPLCQEFSEDMVAGGERGKLRRGSAPSGNEVASEPVLRRKVKMADKLRAIDLDSKLAGHFKPEELIIETGPKTLASIEARAAAVVSALNRRVRK